MPVLSKEQQISSELLAYVSAPRLDFEEDPLLLWKLECRSYPFLSILARKYLCVYFLAKEEIPHMTKYKPLLALLSQLGLPYLDILHKGENATCTSHRIVEEFLTLLGDSVRSNLVLKLQQSPCFGVICDETTDLSTSNQLIVYIKAIVNNVVETYFLALQEGTADSVTQCLKDILEEHGLQISKCAALGSDGSSVMIGVHNGVSAQLQHVQPSLINVHCVAHRLALAVVSQATKVVGPVARFKNYINSL